MHKVIFRSTRPNTTINFFQATDDYKKLIEVEKRNGKLLQESISYVDNDLTERCVLLWTAVEDVINFNKQKDVQEFHAARYKHNIANNIILNVIGETYNE